MGSRTLFALRVIRCPACHARLPVQGADSVVRCEYCDAHVQLGGSGPKKKKKKQQHGHQPVAPSPHAPSVAEAPTHVAQPHYSGCAWIVFIIPLLSVVGVGISVFASMGLQWGDVEMLWHDLTGSPSGTREPAGSPEPLAQDQDRAPQAGSETDEDAEETDEIEEEAEPGRVGRLFSNLADRAEQAEAEAAAEKKRAAARQRRRAATPSEPEPSGPLLSVSEAKTKLEPAVLECMKTAGVHHVTARMGNAKEGGVSILMSASAPRPRVDGAQVNLPSTALGRCMNAAGARVRTQAFKGNYVIIDVRNPAAQNPLRHLPREPAYDEIRAVVKSFDVRVHACAREHGDQGRRRTPIRLRFDGPTGKLVSVSPMHTSKGFNACVEAVYREGAYPKTQQHVVELQYVISL
jgi:hypothetical protein